LRNMLSTVCSVSKTFSLDGRHQLTATRQIDCRISILSPSGCQKHLDLILEQRRQAARAILSELLGSS
jgi:hypothetical protein